jgi:hypothetical protein
MISSANKSIAREVHELPFSAQLCDDPNLIKAAQLQSKATKSAPNQLQDGTYLAIEKLRTAIKDGASAEESGELLLDAIHNAEKWATHD